MDQETRKKIRRRHIVRLGQSAARNPDYKLFHEVLPRTNVGSLDLAELRDNKNNLCRPRAGGHVFRR
jgi:hypothetical protein